MLRGRTVVVGVSGGIAAYKACELVRWLRQRHASVVVVMTPAAIEFVTPLTFQALSGNPVVTTLWGDQHPRLNLPAAAASKMGGAIEHVDVAEASDALVIAPATADLIARLVHGEAPDALTATALAMRGPVIVCPAMDREMWEQPATRANMRTLRARGVTIVGPESGALASGLSGPGRLAAIETIGEAVEQAVARRASLDGVHVLVGAGRTEEPLDPVRVLTNRSSGRMGLALAEAARDRGAQVTLVSGPTSVDAPSGVALVRVTTAAEMARAMTAAAAAADMVLMAAAVADYRPVRASKEKLKRDTARMTIELAPNPDILAGLTGKRRKGQVFVGFALETSQGLARARAKLMGKGLDLVVLNAPKTAIGSDTNQVTLVEARGATKLPTQSKREVAEAILDRAIALRGRAAPAKTGARRAIAQATRPVGTTKPARTSTPTGRGGRNR